MERRRLILTAVLFLLSFPVLAQTSPWAGKGVQVPKANWMQFLEGKSLFVECEKFSINDLTWCYTKLSLENRKADWELYGIVFRYWEALIKIDNYVRADDRHLYLMIISRALIGIRLMERQTSTSVVDICTSTWRDNAIPNSFQPSIQYCSGLVSIFSDWEKRTTE
jgi:hypothetical protein